MKKAVFVLMFLLSVQFSFSQESIREMALSMGVSLDNEIKGENNTYMVDSSSILCQVSNKVFYFENISSKLGQGDFRVKIEDFEIVKQIFRENLSEHFKQYQLDVKDNITLRLWADISGKVRDVSFMYDTKWNIPIVALEQIEQKLKEQCRLVFDRNTPALSQANYVPYAIGISVKNFCY